jgi:hypothetical protein
MALIRDEVRAMLRRHSEVIAAGVAAAAGLWLAAQGGWLLLPLGLVMAGLAGLWAVQAWWRLRFRQVVAAPGVVELDEGQIGYLAPGFGGFVTLHELIELRLIRVHGARVWRLKQADGQALLIPVAATGSDRLFDAFAALPGLRPQALVAAIEAPDAEDRLVWRRGAPRPAAAPAGAPTGDGGRPGQA